MVKIYVSLPVHNPNGYAHGSRLSWDQITYFVYNAILAKFPNITSYSQFNNDLPITKNDVLISCVCGSQLGKFPDRTIIVDNDNFEVGKWKRGRFDKYGLNAETAHTYIFNHLLEGLYGAIIKTNDVAMRKWNTDHEDVFEKKQFLLANVKNLVLSQHPIDKNYFGKFYDPNLKLSKLKMLVYHGGSSKNAAQLIDMLGANFQSSSYSVIGGISKTDQGVRSILSEYAYLAHTSYSEGFPYFANEFLAQGLPLYGHEEWWEPYGHDILKWTYDPERQDQNLSNLKILLSDDFKEPYYKMRNKLIQSHLDRTDNNWSTLTDKLIIMIEDLLANSAQ